MTRKLPAGVPAPGDAAPDFELSSDNGALVRLSSLRGQPVVLFFYPKAMTPGCTIQACSFRDLAQALAAHDVAVLGISPDPVERLQSFRSKEGLNFRLLSDVDHVAAEAYGVWRQKVMFAKRYLGIIRSQFVIGPDGRVAATHYRVAPGDSARKALAELEAP